jgi:hypothetical protein
MISPGRGSSGMPPSSGDHDTLGLAELEKLNRASHLPLGEVIAAGLPQNIPPLAKTLSR